MTIIITPKQGRDINDMHDATDADWQVPECIAYKLFCSAADEFYLSVVSPLSKTLDEDLLKRTREYRLWERMARTVSQYEYRALMALRFPIKL